MSQNQFTYALDFGSRRGRTETRPAPEAGVPIPRIARLLALAIRMEELVRERKIRDYAEAARLGRVTRARMTQIMKLLDLAPEIQEQILFLPPISGLHERALRPIANRIDWDEQRRLFHQLAVASS
jgi:hypothetical protein